jgi:hypothetical protein
VRDELLDVEEYASSGVSDHNGSGTLTHREALVLGIALALNNIAAGPAGAAGIPPILVTGLALLPTHLRDG